MGRRFRKAAVALAVAAVTAFATSSAHAGLSQEFAPSGNDSIDWGQLGPSFTLVSNPVDVTSVGGLTATISMPAVSNFERRDEGLSGGWVGDFTIGDHLLHRSDLADDGTITIRFSSPIFGAGMQIEAANYGDFVARISAYDASSTLLGSFTQAGTTSGAEDGSAPFLGILDTIQEIASIKISLDSAAEGITNDFAVNQVSLTAGPTVVPEPSTLAISSILLGMFGGVGLRRRFSI
jgi:hypothetical protein